MSPASVDGETAYTSIPFERRAKTRRANRESAIERLPAKPTHGRKISKQPITPHTAFAS
jgi:hypothetical protein